jgi:hypothetical protein
MRERLAAILETNDELQRNRVEPIRHHAVSLNHHEGTKDTKTTKQNNKEALVDSVPLW